MTCSDAASIARWSGHVDGATRLIEVRGEDQLDRPEGLALFTHLRVAIVSQLASRCPSSLCVVRAPDTIPLEHKRDISRALQLADDYPSHTEGQELQVFSRPGG